MSPNDKSRSGPRPPLPRPSPPRSPTLPRKRETEGRGKGDGREEADDAQRRVAFRFGLSAESRAAALLIAKGYRILARRFRTPLGEIDIVARRRGVLVFVEVKARDSFDTAAEAIGKRQ